MPAVPAGGEFSWPTGAVFLRAEPISFLFTISSKNSEANLRRAAEPGTRVLFSGDRRPANSVAGSFAFRAEGVAKCVDVVREQLDGVAQNLMAFGDSFETLVNGHVLSQVPTPL